MDTINVLVEKVSLLDKVSKAAQSPVGFAAGCVIAVGTGFYLGCKLSQRRDAAAAEKFQKEMLAEIANLEAELASK